MDILKFHTSLLHNYRSYIQSFVNIKDPRIATFVEDKIGDKTLWPEPLIQFNPTFEEGSSAQNLADEGVLHPAIGDIFNHPLYKHQEEAIRLGAGGREFIVTSGTGSGKSLTYLATIFNHVLKNSRETSGKTIAVIVYPMNALINSQSEALDKYKIDYIQKYNQDFPITFGQFTGQESEAERERLRTERPHILLTNYMMLELIMTRAGRDIDLRKNILDHIEFLVFDELHTYRGRQGADVAMLIRRIKNEARHPIRCIGTSATMVSQDGTSLSDQKNEVARIGSQIFGTTIQADQVVNEYLVRSIDPEYKYTGSTLQDTINTPVNTQAGKDEFLAHPTAHWLEDNIALEWREEQYVRRKPCTLKDIIDQLSSQSGASKESCEQHLNEILHWANVLNTAADQKKTKNLLPFKVHQFIAQTGSVYSTLGDSGSRELSMDAGRYDTLTGEYIFPLVFSRTSGHEFYCVELDLTGHRILPREFATTVDQEEMEEEISSGYLFMDHPEDEGPIWEPQRDLQDLPDGWFNAPRKDGTRSPKKDKADRLPRQIHYDAKGNFSFDDPLDFKAWYMPAPLLFDPTSGQFFDHQTAEWTKLMKLGGEGRSTATTVLSFEIITQMALFGQQDKNQKLLSFTDNRQDASLQSGHFNDFIKVGQIRSAVVKALDINRTLDYSNIASKVLEALHITQDAYASHPGTFPGPRQENEEAFKDYILYKLIDDLRRSWRVVMPNLEQCGLLDINYQFIDQSISDATLWEGNSFLYSLPPDSRKTFLIQLFDYFRKSYAISFSALEPGVIHQKTTRIREKLKDPWTLEDAEKIEIPAVLRIERLAQSRLNMYAVSGGYTSALGRYIRKFAQDHGQPIQGADAYNEFIYDLLDFLSDQGGWLRARSMKSIDDQDVQVYQLLLDKVIWCKSNGNSIRVDEIKNRSYKPIVNKPNEYFQRFYTTDFQQLKPIEGAEHTGQINNLKRREREEKFRAGNISALFCSPTMELGIDISELSIVHMRNVPPSPANYAQRAGRAGRSGQAALVMVYCSNFSSHDRHFFKEPARMVAGNVSAPRMDLINEELLRSHLYAAILTRQPLDGLRESIGDIIETENIKDLPLKFAVQEQLKIPDQRKKEIIVSFDRLIRDEYFSGEFERRKPQWYTTDWIERMVNQYAHEFDKALNRWRDLYQNAIYQFRRSNEIIESAVFAENHPDKKEARKQRKQAERQKDLLLNETNNINPNLTSSLSEFYPYRYLASEGFLPGYGFTRLPVRTFMENREGTGEFVSRPRTIALREFGPRNVIYHDGAKYRIDRMILTESETRMQPAKISPRSGYIMMNDQYNFLVDPVTRDELTEGMDKYIHRDLIEMSESKATELQRITCQEEERTRRGYDVKTFFSIDGDFESLKLGLVSLSDDELLKIHLLPAARLVHVNFRWKGTSEQGFALNLKSGYWKSASQENDETRSDEIRNVKLFTSTTANAIYIQPIPALAVNGGRSGVITLMYALKKAIENYFQVESNEIGADIMGEHEVPNILLYEASEGSLGILEQIVVRPDVYNRVMEEAFQLCFIKDGQEIPKEDLVPATYDDLLSYYNQHHHRDIDRNLIRESLRMLRESTITSDHDDRYKNYEDHFRTLDKRRDQTSSTEQRFLKFLFDHQYKLPDEAQPIIPDMYVRPDFFYKPNVCLFCDGSPHDQEMVARDDDEKRNALKKAGYQVLVWHYKDDLEYFIQQRPDIFRKVKQG